MKPGWDRGATRVLQVTPRGAHDARDVVRPSSSVDQAGLHPRPQEVDMFLAMDEHGAGVRGGAGNRPMAWASAKVFPVDTPTGPGEVSLGEGLDPVGMVVVWHNHCAVFLSTQ